MLRLLVLLPMAACATAGTEPPNNEPDTGVAPDAPPTPDAPPPADAPCTDVIQELLQNAGFDNGPGVWQQQSPFNLIRTMAELPVAPQSGTYAVWLGGDNSLSEALWQDVAVPAGARDLEISGYRWIESNEPNATPIDGSIVSLRSTAGDLLETAGQWSNANETGGWVRFSFTATGSYAGQTVRFQIESATDGVYPTSFLYDTMSFQATVCQ